MKHMRLFSGCILCLMLYTSVWAQVDETLRIDGAGLVAYNRVVNSLNNLPVSVVYYRGDWRENGKAFLWPRLEPQEGVYDFSSILAVLDEAQAKGVRVGLRIGTAHPFIGPDSPADIQFYPAWIPVKTAQSSDNRTGYAPDWDDPVVQTAIRNLLVALGEAVRDHPAFLFADVGAVGWVGEWHTTVGFTNADFMPTLEHQKRYIDYHIEAFGAEKLLLQLVDMETEIVAYGLAQGINGIRQDCFGSSYHMRQYEQKLHAVPALQKVIDHGMVFFEVCGGNMADWYHQSGDPGKVPQVTQSLTDIFDVAVRWKCTMYANVGAPIPDFFMDTYTAFHRTMMDYTPKPLP